MIKYDQIVSMKGEKEINLNITVACSERKEFALSHFSFKREVKKHFQTSLRYTLLHSEGPKLYGVLAVLIAIGLKQMSTCTPQCFSAVSHMKKQLLLLFFAFQDKEAQIKWRLFLKEKNLFLKEHLLSLNN